MKRETKKAPENIMNISKVSIPSAVLFDPELTARERILYGMLSDLAERSPDGYVYATNIDLGAMLGIDPQTASNSVRDLRKNGFILVEYGSTTSDGGMVYEHYDGNDSWSRVRRVKPVPQD